MMRKMGALGALLAGIALAASPRGAVAQTASGERVQAFVPATAVQAQPAPATAAPAQAPNGAAAAGAVPGSDSSAVARFGPSVAGAELLTPAPAEAQQRTLAHTPAYRHDPGVPLMIVGGAMFVAGAIIGNNGGDVLMVAGVVVAAVGLYQYLQ